MYELDNIDKDGIVRCHLCGGRASVKTWLELENEPWEPLCAGCSMRLLRTGVFKNKFGNPLYYAKQMPRAIMDYIKEKAFGIYL